LTSAAPVSLVSALRTFRLAQVPLDTTNCALIPFPLKDVCDITTASLNFDLHRAPFSLSKQCHFCSRTLQSKTPLSLRHHYHKTILFLSGMPNLLAFSASSSCNLLALARIIE
jgi:hypothetical protein